MIRDGFVSNSSSTSYIIFTNEEITREFLLEKFGITKNSPLYDAILELVDHILREMYYITSNNSIESIEEFIKCTPQSESLDKDKALKFGKFTNGRVSSDDAGILQFLCLSSLEFSEDDFYFWAMNNEW